MALKIVMTAGMLLALLALRTDEAGAATYRRWQDCGGVGLPIPNLPAAEMAGIKCYLSPQGKLVFVRGVNTIYCQVIGPDWQLKGFVYGTRNPGAPENILLFKITKKNKERYFDVQGQKEVYRLPEPKDKVVISDTPVE